MNKKQMKEYYKEYAKQPHIKNKQHLLFNKYYLLDKEYRANKKEKKKQYQKEYNLFNSKRVRNGCYDFIQMINQY